VFYEDYYEQDFSWPEQGHGPDLNLTRETFHELGLSPDQVDRLLRSGFVICERAPSVVIDRYYGGELLSTDHRTRIYTDHFVEWLEASQRLDPLLPSRARVYLAGSRWDLDKQLEEIATTTRRPTVYRGQTRHHSFDREIPNNAVAVPGLGEVSLLPSVWRRMREARPDTFHRFTGPTLFEWSTVFFAQFGLDEVAAHHRALEERDGPFQNYWDMEDSDDPLLQEFGRVALDLAMGMDSNLADPLNTLLQHYGLLSPYLDLSTDVDVALFFATHQFHAGSPDRYEAVGTAGGRSAIYVFAQDREMTPYREDRVLGSLNASRPINQSCVVARSSPFALNLPADLLIGVVHLDFEISPSDVPAVQTLFPDSDTDMFLKAVLQSPFGSAHATVFS
jgi:FRG domain